MAFFGHLVRRLSWLSNASIPLNLNVKNNPSASLVNQLSLSNLQNRISIRRMASSNKLGNEKSPYLLQHANNPVHWYPWGEEAFEAARKENKLIFLSVGYSTCHWCHVMERESFENEEIGEIMNRHYISVKVDREERPDVDKVYMNFVQASTGGGGWPMSVFLTPTLKPIFGGTYFPPEDMMFGRPGFKSILLNIAKQWESKRDQLVESGDKIVEALSDAARSSRSGSEDAASATLPNVTEVVIKCLAQLATNYDVEFGGFSRAPKFPQPVNFNFIFHLVAVQKSDKEEVKAKSLEMVLNTLDMMAKGGIYDHVSKGFARYSTDQAWHVPHFEKMLYDQGQLAVAYSRAYQATGDAKYARVIREIIEYVTRDLRHPLGGFYSGEDADSLPTHDADKKREGAFCVWTFSELEKLLIKADSDRKPLEIFCAVFNVRPEGNVAAKADPHGELQGQNVLTAVGSDLDQIKSDFGLTDETLDKILNDCKAILYEARQKRPRPHLDDKILTAWNGLMISGLCAAGTSLKDPSYIDQAVQTASFIRSHLYNETKKRLLRSVYNDKAGGISQLSTPINGFVDDYAYLIRGLIDLYEATFDPAWLEWAVELQEIQNQLFWDSEAYGYFTSPEGDPSIVMRLKEDQDGAEPAANSVSAVNLIRLSSFLDRSDLREKAEKIFTAFGTTLSKFPLALPEMTTGLMLLTDTPIQIIISGDPKESPMTREMLATVHSMLLPQKVLVVADGNQESILYKSLKILSNISASGPTSGHVCHKFACSTPVSTKEQLVDQIESFYK